MIKFFMEPYESPEKANYQHGIVVLAEGLRELGHSFCGNIDYWWDTEKADYLIKANDGQFEIGVFSSTYLKKNPDSAPPVKKRIIVDLSDGIYGDMNNIKFDRQDYYLRAHFNRHYQYPQNVFPWAFGLSNRIMKALDETRNRKLTYEAMVSFRVDHSLRGELLDKIQMHNKLKIHQFQDNQRQEDFPHHWAQSGGRHSDLYYSCLNQSSISLAFGGYYTFTPGLPRLVKSIVYRFSRWLPSTWIARSQTIYQFDSWRFWESLYSNAIPVHVDFERWGFQLPVNPVAYKHYLPIDSDGTIRTLEENELNQIAQNSVIFAKENYSPLAQTKRMLNIIGE